MVAEPFILNDNDGKSQTIKSQYVHTSVANAVRSDGFGATMIAEPIRVGQVGNGGQGCRIYSIDGKSVTLSANGGGWGAKTGLYAIPKNLEISSDKIYEVKNGIVRLKDKEYPIKLSDGFYAIRKLTPIEAERLQTLPDDYTAGISNTQRYKCIGNGWTVEVIVHILKNLSC